MSTLSKITSDLAGGHSEKAQGGDSDEKASNYVIIDKIVTLVIQSVEFILWKCPVVKAFSNEEFNVLRFEGLLQGFTMMCS